MPDVYILTILRHYNERSSTYVVDQEVFSERPTFPPEDAVPGVGRYTVELRQANINGGDSIQLFWDDYAKQWAPAHSAKVV